MTRADVGARQARYRYLDPEVLARLGKINLVARHMVEGFISGLHKSPVHGFSVEFSEHRQYAPGDDLRHLDWFALAKTDRYYVKQFEQETNLRAYILLDCSASMNYSSGKLTKLQYGSFLAATLAFIMTRQADLVGLVAFDEKIRLHIPPGGSPAHLNQMCERLESLKPGTQTNVSKTFHDLAETIKRRGLIIIISDLYDDEREVARALKHFRQKKHGLIIFHVFDPFELQFPFKRLTDFRDMESDERYQVDPKAIRNEYLAELNTFIDGYKRVCSDSAIEYVLTDTSVPYDFMLTSYLAKRRKFR